MNPKCRRCSEEVEDCPTCKGDGQYHHPGIGASTCTARNGTGKLCPRDGRHWQ